jgi:hypothetical protein
VKEFLSREGAAFEVKSVEEDHDAYTALLALGVRTVPLTIIGTERIKGFDPAALRRALEACAGESSRDR